MDEGYNTAGEFIFDLKNELNRMTSWYLPIFVDGKQIKKGSVEIIQDSERKYILTMNTIDNKEYEQHLLNEIELYKKEISELKTREQVSLKVICDKRKEIEKLKTQILCNEK